MSNTFQKIKKNPYVVGNPIKDSAMFFGREADFLRIQESIEQGGAHVIQLIAERRSGKTSLLFEIHRGRLQDIAEAVFMDFHAIAPRIQTDEDLPLEIGNAILQNPRFAEFAEDFHNPQQCTWTTQLFFLIDRCLEKIAPRYLLILCDEFEAIEEAFKTAQLSSKAMQWAKPILEKPVFFITTGSHQFEHAIIRDQLSRLSQPIDIQALATQDALRLIQEPVKGKLDYPDDVAQHILRLAGNQPFYIQYLCQNLVTQNNAVYQHAQISSEDLEDTISFIIKSPHGHVHETWKDPIGQRLKGAEKNWYVCQIQHFLGSLARSLTDADSCVTIDTVLINAKEKNFSLHEDTVQSIYSWLKEHTSLLDVHETEDKCRFQVDLLRRWITFKFRRGDDIDAYNGQPCPAQLNETINPNNLENQQLQNDPYFLQVKQALQTDNIITLAERQTLDKLAQELGLSSQQQIKIEHTLRKQLNFPQLDWLEEYKQCCQWLKRQYPKKIPIEKSKQLTQTYEQVGRVTQEQAKEIREYLGLNKKPVWGWLFGLLVLLGICIWLVFNWEDVNSENTATEGGADITGDIFEPYSIRPTGMKIIAVQQSNTPFDLDQPFNTQNNGTLNISANGSYRYTPPVQGEVPTNGLTELFIYELSDDAEHVTKSSLTITVENQNLSPQAQEDTYTVKASASPLSGNLLEGDDIGGVKDNIGDEPTILSSVRQEDKELGLNVLATTKHSASLTVNSDGSYHYTPPARDLVTVDLYENFVYTIVDTDGDTSAANFVIQIQKDTAKLPITPEVDKAEWDSRFIKLAQDGKKLPSSAEQWQCIYDSENQLIWEVKTASGLRIFSKKYKWDDLNELVNQVNKVTICGYATWRVPTFNELSTLYTEKNSGSSNNTESIYLNPSLFPYIDKLKNPIYWSSNQQYTKIYRAKAIDFSMPLKQQNKSYRNKTNHTYARLVTSK